MSMPDFAILSMDDRTRLELGILNAYHLPQGGSDLLYDFITPVNTFRLIFNYYFGADYDLLSDRSYIARYGTPYRFNEVTDISTK